MWTVQVVRGAGVSPVVGVEQHDRRAEILAATVVPVVRGGSEVGPWMSAVVAVIGPDTFGSGLRTICAN